MNISGAALLLFVVAGVILIGASSVNEFADQSSVANHTSQEDLDTMNKGVGTYFTLISYVPYILGGMGLIYVYSKL